MSQLDPSVEPSSTHRTGSLSGTSLPVMNLTPGNIAISCRHHRHRKYHNLQYVKIVKKTHMATLPT
eukprot:5620044-Amphidinium_carterae.1